MLHIILLVFALVLFILASFLWWNVPTETPRRLNLIAAGLAFWVASELFAGVGPALH